MLSVQMLYWRKCCGLTLLEHVRNESKRQKIMAQDPLLDIKNAKQLKWFSHLHRTSKERIPWNVRNWIPPQIN